MKVVFISDFYRPFIGGAEEVCRMEAEELVKRGHDVSVITTTPSEYGRRAEEISGVKVYRVDLPELMFKIRLTSSGIQGILWFATGLINYLLGVYNPFAVPVVRPIIEKNRPDIVHVHNFMGKFSWSILKVLQELKIPVVLTVHDYLPICPRATLSCYSGLPCKVPKKACKALRMLQRLLLDKKIEMLISPSNFLATRIMESGFSQIAVVPNPVEKEASIVKKDYGDFHILYVGRLKWLKGVHVLIEAFKGLKRENVKLHIVGRGSEELRLKKFSGLDPRIIFHGFISETKKRELLRRASITVIPSLWCEPFPLTALESFQSGTPVVASKIGGLPEVVEDGYNGRLFEPGNSKELKRIIEELITDKETLNKLKEGAVESVDRYDINEHVAKLEKVYDKLVC